jgi:protein-disulfide isomerase
MANHKWENSLRAEDRWVEGRLASLESDRGWVPDAGVALALLRERRHARRIAARRWIWTTIAASATMAVLMTIPASRACAQQPGACVQRIFHTSAGTAVTSPPLVAVPSVGPAVPESSARPGGIHSPQIAPVGPETPPADFREIGSVSAPVCVDIYIDFDCGHCGAFVRDVVPRLRAKYVDTGRVKLVLHNYPLPSHPYARLAARYADAAGELGYYGAAVEQLFATRQTWDESGDIDSQIAQVIPADAMEQLRVRLRNGGEADPALSADVAAGQADHLDRTPFVVVAAGGKRQAITETPLSFEAIARELDLKLKP